MNVFALDYSPAMAARYHCNKHVVKMIVETAQMLSTINRSLGINEGYLPTHAHHPCVLQTASNRTTYMWVRTLGFELCKEYTRRYGKVHKTQAVLESLSIPVLPDGDTLNLPKCMPEIYHRQDLVDSYRAYYRGKQFMMSMAWPDGEVPEWL